MARRRMTSIVQQARKSVFTIALLLAVPAAMALITALISSSQYQGMIRRMDRAAELKAPVETTLAENMFYVAAGRIDFEESGAMALLDQVNQALDELLAETSGNGNLQLTVARRTMETMEQYVLQVRDGMAEGAPISQMEQIVDEIRDVGRLTADMLDDFISEEIRNASDTSQRLWRIALAFAGVEILLLVIGLTYTRMAMKRLSTEIRTALSSLESTVRRIAEGDFRHRLPQLEVEELQELGEHINGMAERLETLIEETKVNQEHLAKAELRTLQAQINPHFLYNTLDTIVWQAESGKREEVVRLTRSLSDFFRISLSSGADWIPVSQEMKHVSAYLSVQQVRYRDILSYEVEMAEGMAQHYMLKLLLQPLVENALYHGIKEKRGGGRITVRAWQEGDELCYRVSDTGRGMSAERLCEIRGQLEKEKPTAMAALEPGHSGFGLRNVDMRIRLYYQQEQGLQIASGPEGTTISFRIPARAREDISHDESLSGGR